MARSSANGLCSSRTSESARGSASFSAQRTHARDQRIAALEMEGPHVGFLRALDMRTPFRQHRPQRGLLPPPPCRARAMPPGPTPPAPTRPSYPHAPAATPAARCRPSAARTHPSRAAHLHIQHRPVRHHARRIQNRDHVVTRQPLRPVNRRAPGVVDMAQIVVVDREAVARGRNACAHGYDPRRSAPPSPARR